MKQYKLKGIGPPYEKQQEIINYLLTPSDSIKQVAVTCGRGFGKSLLGIIIAIIVLSSNSNEIGLFLEPDWSKINKVFLKKWQTVVPRSLYKINKKECLIIWHNGSRLYYGPRNITGSESAREDSQLGGDYSFVIDDESALGCNEVFYTNTLGCVRHPSKHRFYLMLSTPRLGEYEYIISSGNHKLFQGTSLDNPYLPADYVDNLIKNMSSEQVQREIYAKFISLKGKIWKEWSDDPWPRGNINYSHKTFDKNKPFWLFCDIGKATGSYVIVQSIPATIPGLDKKFDGFLWVAVADYCPKDDASASRAFQRIKKEFGCPICVVGGRDLKTGNSVSGDSVYYFAMQIFGNKTSIRTVSEDQYSKQLQYDNLSYLICDSLGNRRFCISKDFVSLDTESRRGIREMMVQDQWLPESKRRESDILPKNKEVRVQHIRDALLMGTMAIMQPPEFDYRSNPAL